MGAAAGSSTVYNVIRTSTNVYVLKYTKEIVDTTAAAAGTVAFRVVTFYTRITYYKRVYA